jgi:hypothetical protein
MLELLKRRLRAMGAEDESDTDYDGFLSYSAETHAVGHGLYHGLRTRRLTAGAELPDNEDVQAEPAYFKGAFVAGTILQWVGGGTAAIGMSTLL